VVLILVDDLGWQDVGSYDIDEPTPMETPNIDALAKKRGIVQTGVLPGPHLCTHPVCDDEWAPCCRPAKDPCGGRKPNHTLQ
jgi:hypothetical protein